MPPIYSAGLKIGIKFAIQTCKLPNCIKQFYPILLDLIALENLIVYL
jgi:hypothetical protein